jgi:hypothetical protein
MAHYLHQRYAYCGEFTGSHHLERRFGAADRRRRLHRFRRALQRWVGRAADHAGADRRHSPPAPATGGGVHRLHQFRPEQCNCPGRSHSGAGCGAGEYGASEQLSGHRGEAADDPGVLRLDEERYELRRGAPRGRNAGGTGWTGQPAGAGGRGDRTLCYRARPDESAGLAIAVDLAGGAPCGHANCVDRRSKRRRECIESGGGGALRSLPRPTA